VERLRHHPVRTERVSRLDHAQLADGRPRLAPPGHDEILAGMAQAEHGIGWLAACEEAGRYLAITGELAEAIAAALAERGINAALEVCAGDGTLAAALRERGIAVTATDAAPPQMPTASERRAPEHRQTSCQCHPVVERMAASEALERYQPRNVIGCFVPFDAGVDPAVLDQPSVQRYLLLNARLNGQLGDPALRRKPGWRATRLESVERWMLTRHDVWLGPDRPPLTHGEAWLLERTSG